MMDDEVSGVQAQLTLARQTPPSQHRELAPVQMVLEEQDTEDETVSALMEMVTKYEEIKNRSTPTTPTTPMQQGDYTAPSTASLPADHPSRSAIYWSVWLEDVLELVNTHDLSPFKPERPPADASQSYAAATPNPAAGKKTKRRGRAIRF